MTQQGQTSARLIRQRKALKAEFKKTRDPEERRSIHGKISAITRKLKDRPAGQRRTAQFESLGEDTKKAVKAAFKAGSKGGQLLALQLVGSFGNGPENQTLGSIKDVCKKAGCLTFVLASVVLGGDATLLFYTPDIVRGIWATMRGKEYKGEQINRKDLSDIADRIESGDIDDETLERAIRIRRQRKESAT